MQISLYLLLLAHAIADFVFQKDTTVQRKNGGQFRSHLHHAFVVFVLSYLFLIPFEGLDPLYLAGLVFLIHLFLDYLKYFVDLILRKDKEGFRPITFLFDQVLHIISLIVLNEMFALTTRPFFDNLFRELGSLEHYLATAVVYTFVVFGGAFFVRVLLDSLPSTEKQEMENSNKGRLIGILERATVLTLWLTASPTSIALVLTAKSIARFKEFENRDFAEYYLIGTLASVLFAITGGIILNGIYH